MKKAEFKVRIQPQDVPNQKNPNHKQAAKVFIHPTTFAQGGFITAHLCNVEADGLDRWEVVAWPAPDKNVANNIVSISRAFQKAAGLELGQVVRLTPGSTPAPDAGVVVMSEITPDASPLPASEQTRWQYHLESRLGQYSVSFSLMLRGHELQTTSPETRVSLAWFNMRVLAIS
ncbi:hypothetical protein F4779DRAFT_565910 [Xylariaceae sp. FL0662B]|nr:hypothetical protein F4779DRAFT_565910 [Xylariaceae sp. FL0662B]